MNKTKATPLVECRNLCKQYDNKIILNNINLKIPRGKIIGLLGRNGAGKSTFIKSLNGLITPASGEVLIDGQPVGVNSKNLISYLPERTYLEKTMTVQQALYYFAEFYQNFNLEKATALVQDLSLNLDTKISKMSKGMQEKLQLILVMSRKAELYILDEPLGGIDPATRDYILDTILSNFNAGASVLISTHLISDIERILDEVIFIENGKIILTAETDQLRTKHHASIDEIFRQTFKAKTNRRYHMLHKLLKYDLRAIYRQLVVFYIIAFSCAIIGRVFSNYDNNLLFKIIHEFFSGVALGLCFGIVVNNATRIWEYTKRDFYGDQSYLTHTLPVPRSNLYLAKFLTILITTITSLTVIIAIVFMNYASPETFELIHESIRSVGSKAEFVKFAILLLNVIFLETVFIIQAGITGIILGHKANNRKTAMSFVYGFTIFILANITTVTLASIWGIFDPEIHRAMQGSISNSIMTKLLCGAIFIYLAHIATEFYIGCRSFQKGIDVE